MLLLLSLAKQATGATDEFTKASSVLTLSPRRLVLEYTPQVPLYHQSTLLTPLQVAPDASIAIEWKKSRLALQFSPAFYHHESGGTNYILAPFIEAELNSTRNINSLFVAIRHTSLGVNSLERALFKQRHGESTFAKSSFALVPRSIGHVRFLYKGTYAIDFRFLGRDLASLEGPPSS